MIGYFLYNLDRNYLDLLFFLSYFDYLYFCYMLYYLVRLIVKGKGNFQLKIIKTIFGFLTILYTGVLIFEIVFYEIHFSFDESPTQEQFYFCNCILKKIDYY